MSCSSRGRSHGGRGGGKSAHRNWVIKSPIDQQDSSPSLDSAQNHQPVRGGVQKSIIESVLKPHQNPIDPKVEEPNSDFFHQEQVSQDSGKNLEFSEEPIRKNQKPQKNRRNSKRVSRNSGEKKSEDQGSSREVVGVLSSCVEEKVEESGLGDDVWRRMEELQLGAEEPELSNEQLRINDQAQEDEVKPISLDFEYSHFICSCRSLLLVMNDSFHFKIVRDI